MGEGLPHAFRGSAGGGLPLRGAKRVRCPLSSTKILKGLADRSALFYLQECVNTDKGGYPPVTEDLMSDQLLKQALDHFDRHAADHLNKLKELIRVPSVSFPGFDPCLL